MTIPILRCEPEPITRGWLCLLLLVVVTVGDLGCYFCSFNFPTCGVSEDGLDVFPRSNVTSFGAFCASLF